MNKELHKRLFYINKGDCKQFPFPLRCQDCMYEYRCKDLDFAENEIYEDVKKYIKILKGPIEQNQNQYKQRAEYKKGIFRKIKGVYRNGKYERM